MANYCDNCGCRKSNGYCTGCEEEAYIAFVQDPDYEFSEPFMEKAWQQEKERNKGGDHV